jgi:hypothetical protein
MPSPAPAVAVLVQLEAHQDPDPELPGEIGQRLRGIAQVLFLVLRRIIASDQLVIVEDDAGRLVARDHLEDEAAEIGEAGARALEVPGQVVRVRHGLDHAAQDRPPHSSACPS